MQIKTAAGESVRAGNASQDRQGDRHPIDQLIEGGDVRFWPLADIASCTAHVRFWGHDDLTNSERTQFAKRDVRH